MKSHKKLISLLSLWLLFIWNIGFWYVSANYIEAANKLAQDWVIVDNSSNTANYRVDDQITRWEMAKITLNLSKKWVNDSCSWIYKDLKSTDWACKYAESWNKYGFFATNNYFRPSENISKAEALKMIMQARWISKWSSSDWRLAYVEWALTNWILNYSFTDYDNPAIRWWIFEIATKEIWSSWVCDWEVCNFDPLIDNLLNELLWENNWATSKLEQKCWVENCHWLDIKCWPNVAEICTQQYVAWDSCRQFATCEIVSGNCQLQVSSKFNLCKSCVEKCETDNKVYTEKFMECESQCSKV